jgi:hypothetical protein
LFTLDFAEYFAVDFPPEADFPLKADFPPDTDFPLETNFEVGFVLEYVFS